MLLSEIGSVANVSLPHHTRQVVVAADGSIDLHLADLAPLQPGEVLVRMKAVGICGSDVHAAHGRHPFVPRPYHPGHEVLGVVEAAADNVAIAAGTRVVIEPIFSCGTCKYCRDGRYNLCSTMTFFGSNTPTGGMADLFTIPAHRVVTVPPEFSDLQAVLIEPLAAPVHAASLVDQTLAGKDVAILGAGTIGLLAVAVARRGKARRIVVSDVSTAKRTRAADLGADAVFDATSPDLVQAMRDDLGTSADVVFDCVSIQSTVDQAFRLAQKGGTVVIVGVPGNPITIPLPELQDSQVRIQGSALYTRDDFIEAIAMIGDSLVRPDDFVSAKYPLSRVSAAFAAATTGEQVKVVLLADSPA